MATLEHIGPYVNQTALAPGQREWVEIEQPQGADNGAVAVTATVRAGEGGDTHVLTVDSVKTTAVETPDGDSPLRFHTGGNVTNNGETTITEWQVVVGVIAP